MITKREVKQEINKIRELQGEARYRYIWDYYKIPIIALIFVIFLFGYIGNMLRGAVSEHTLYVTFVNTTKDLGTHTQLWDEYMDYIDYDDSQGPVEFNSDSYFDYLDNKARNNKYYEMMITYIEAKTMDAAVMESEALLSMAESGWFLDLEDEKCQSIKEKYGDRFLTCVPIDESYNGQEVAVAIDITDSILMSDYQIYPEGTRYALAIGAFSENEDAIEAFLDMILETNQNQVE